MKFKFNLQVDISDRPPLKVIRTFKGEAKVTRGKPSLQAAAARILDEIITDQDLPNIRSSKFSARLQKEAA